MIPKLLTLIIVLGVVLFMGWGTAAYASVFHFSGVRPTNLGVTEGHLLACPASPNCVSSQSQDEAHKIEPLHYATDRATAMVKLAKVISTQPNSEVIKSGEDYIYSEFTSKIMGYVDDVEFYAPPGEKIIEVRSASRLGESDLGVNRNRIETIRSQFE